MTTIIAGHFQLQQEIDGARQALLDAGFPNERISAFFVNQPGQHDAHELGGDRLLSPGAKDTPEGLAKGVATGGAVGAAIGAATAPLTGPAGPIVGGLVGAHVGSLYSFSEMKDKGEPEQGGENVIPPRKSGMMIAVALPDGDEARAVELLRGLGAHHIERAEGTITAGDWTDFDPLSLPQLVA
ncbi:outer membrane protein with glycine zipper [Pseudoduganella lurida]|uniref:Outer membrane protein with glycine zipper n=1 Tax=Pseudoduganella lurida TaxID=1036180 RepID=A0A562RP29_9BURK|nr:glycine zipper domain-containing protein [Pseudoduganella lurida]TWI70130.1 outer membrane protein with glycine zipper [Pseudoduganella lurida]